MTTVSMSWFKMNGGVRSLTALSLALAFAVCALLGLLGAAEAQSQSNVYTTYNLYDPPGNNWSLDGLYCATVDNDQSLAWKQQYLWTAYCASAVAMDLSVCGRCISVTNPGTGASVTVRILDKCANGGLDLEQNAFNAIDTDGAGYNAGHLVTSYTFVDC